MKRFLTCFFLIVSLPAWAQQPQLLQERKYLTGPNGNFVGASAPDGAGNILYSGVVARPFGGKLDNKFMLVKPNTDTLWTWKNPQLVDYSYVALQAIGPGKFLAGGNNEVGPRNVMSLNQINSDKTISWNKGYPSVYSMAFAILPLPGKDLMIGGVYNQKSFAFTRTDSVGNVKWSRAYDRGAQLNPDVLVDMKRNRNGDIIALGSTETPVGPNHIKLFLINQNGDSLLGKQLIVNGPNRAETVILNNNSITPLSDGGYLITGDVDTTSSAYPNPIYMGMVVKVDANLNLVWKYVHRTPGTDFIKMTKAKELADGSVIVLGFKYFPNQNNNWFELYRFGLNGQLINTYNFTSSICTKLTITTLDALSDSTYLVGGTCGFNPPISYSFYVAKVKIPGLPLPLPPIAVTGTKEELAINGAVLGQSYPNPTAASAIIPFTLPQRYTKASILIREIATGREIKRYELKRNSSTLSVDLSQLSNGLYLYSLVVDEQPVATKKLAVMK